MKRKVKKIILILNVVFNAIFGIIIYLIHNLVYRYRRMETWAEQNEIYSQLCTELHNIISLGSIIWGVLFLISIYLLRSELRNQV